MRPCPLYSELFNGLEYKIEPQETRFKDMNNISMTRLQLPPSLGYAITMHRSQCMTYSKMVIDLGGKYWKARMFYTVLSRTRRITDIIILAEIVNLSR
jgi:ethanolamine utilization protein EutP (predicted NTPase)